MGIVRDNGRDEGRERREGTEGGRVDPVAQRDNQIHAICRPRSAVVIPCAVFVR